MNNNDFIYPDEPIRFDSSNINEVMIHCINLGASDITLQSNEFIFAEIHGKLRQITRKALSNGEVGDIINGMYGNNGTTQLLSGKDIDTNYQIKHTRNTTYRFRINATACLVNGYDAIQITARVIPNSPPTLQSMELPQLLLDSLYPDKGVVYVTGATGSGKSTLLAAIIRNIAEQAESHRKILTYEAPIEFVYDEVEKNSCVISQTEIPRHLPNFAAGVRNALRRKPRLILVGEARDPETIKAVIEASMTGHPVYTTLHSNSVAETIRRLTTTVPAEERQTETVNILDTLRVIVSQQLIPTVDQKRVALREYMVFNEEIRDELIQASYNDISRIIKANINKYGKTMTQVAEEKFAAGIISERSLKIIKEQYAHDN